LMSIEITTYGFVAEPVLWQTRTFWPAAGELFDDWLACADACVWLECVDFPCVEPEWLDFGWAFALALALAFAFAEADAAAPAFAFAFAFDCFCLLWPGALAEFPCAACWASCFFTWPGALPEFPGGEPWPFPATALPLNATAATTAATTPPKSVLGRCIASPDVVDKSRGGAFV
jgi:hypothetical protein